MAMKKRRVQDFWNERRRVALTMIQERYELRIIELMYLKAALLEEPMATDLNDAIVAKLDAIAEDVRDFFLRNCPTDPIDPSRAQFLATLEDSARQRRHREAWDAIRSSLLGSVLDNIPLMPRAQA